MSQPTTFIGSERVAMLILALVPPALMLPLIIFILLKYTKYHRQLADGMPMFKTTIVFIVLTILFYINYCLRGINFCYGHFKHDGLYIITSTPLYGGHFLFFTVLLFQRLRQIFNDTQYKLAIYTKRIFYGLVVFGLTDAALFILMRFVDMEGDFGLIFYLIGTAAIIVTYLWISILYIIKLFKVMRDSTQSALPPVPSTQGSRHKFASKSNPFPPRLVLSSSVSRSRKQSIQANEHILASITKYCVLTTMSLVTNIVFWCTPFISQDNYFEFQFVYLLLWQLSISVNICAFALGFHFSKELYLKLCVRTDTLCRSCFQKMVDCVVEKHVKNETRNLELEIKADDIEKNRSLPPS
eukprot:243168_1